MPDQASDMTARAFVPDYATPPGATLAEWLDERAMTPAELATRAGLSVTAVSQVIDGAAALGSDTATPVRLRSLNFFVRSTLEWQ